MAEGRDSSAQLSCLAREKHRVVPWKPNLTGADFGRLRNLITIWNRDKDLKGRTKGTSPPGSIEGSSSSNIPSLESTGPC